MSTLTILKILAPLIILIFLILIVVLFNVSEKAKKILGSNSNEELNMSMKNIAAKYYINALVIFNTNDEILFWNRGAEKMFQVSSTIMYRRLLLDIIPEKSRVEHIEWLRTYKTDEITQTGSRLIRTALRPDGVEFPVELNFFLDKSIQGIDLFVVVIEDLTEKNKLKEEIKKQVISFENYERIGKTGGWEWELKTNIVDITPGCAELFDVSRETFLTSIDLIKKIHEDDREEVNHTIIEAQHNNEDYETKYRIRKADKTIIKVLCIAEGIRDDFGIVIKYVGIVRQIEL